MKAKEIGEKYGWYAHFMALCQGDITRLGQIVDTNHKEAFMALSYMADIHR